MHGILSLLVSAILLTGTATAQPAAPGPDFSLPPANGTFDYQLGGAYSPKSSVDIVVRDREAPSVSTKYSICYVNTFQTQPGDKKFWTTKHRDLLVQVKGKLVTDPDWPDEYLFDTSTAAKRSALMRIIGPWIDQCATDGFEAVEPDNLDSWTRSQKQLTAAGNLLMATQLATRAHASGLAIAQKNTPQWGKSQKQRVGFDFAIAEECQVYAECGSYLSTYGKQVYEVEYTDNPRRHYTTASKVRGDRISVILRDRDVTKPSSRHYVYRSC